MKGAVILSGGTGKRMGKPVPKQYISVGGKKILFWCLDNFLTGPEEPGLIDAFVIVAAPEWREEIESYIESVKCGTLFKGFADPGENRQLSIYNGLCALRDTLKDEDPVMIHDAVRPILSPAHIRECFAAAEGHDGSMPSLPMKDTVYLSRDGKSIDSLMERSEVFAGQAPEVFSFGKYLKANEALLPERILLINGSTEAAILSGMDIVMLKGEEGNFKITTPEDLLRFEEIIEKGRKTL